MLIFTRPGYLFLCVPATPTRHSYVPFHYNKLYHRYTVPARGTWLDFLRPFLSFLSSHLDRILSSGGFWFFFWFTHAYTSALPFIRTTLPPTTQMSQSIPFGHSEWKYLFTLSLPKIPFRGQERTRMTRPGNTICQSIQPFRLPLLPRSHPLNKYGEIEIPQLTSGLFNSLLDGGEEALEQQSERGRCFAVVAGG